MIGAILTVKTRGHSKPCGQTMGANGQGDYAWIIEGSPDEAEAWARQRIREMESAGYRIDSVICVRSDDELWGGEAMQYVSPNALLSGKEWLDIIAKRWPTVIFPFKQLVI